MAVTRVECSVGDGNEWRWWQWIETLTDRTGGISMVGGGEEVTTGEEIDRRDVVGKTELLDGGVCSRSHSLACSVKKKRQEVHLGVATLEGRVVGDKG